MKKLFNTQKVVVAALVLTLVAAALEQNFADARSGNSCGCKQEPPISRSRKTRSSRY